MNTGNNHHARRPPSGEAGSALDPVSVEPDRRHDVPCGEAGCRDENRCMETGTGAVGVILRAAGLVGRAAALAAGLALAAGAASGDEPKALPIEQLKAFGEIFDLVKEQYIRPVDDRELLEDAIRGMVNGLDPHSTYLTAEEHRELQEGNSGEFGGLGIEITAEDGLILIITPLDDSPAFEAGLLPGDLVTRVDGESVRELAASEAAKRIRGQPGTPVTLTILREGEEAPLEFTIIRDIVEVASVRSDLIEPGFARIRISQFQARTGARLLEEIQRVEEANGGPLSGAVLDLRNNPGGILSGAVSVADAFLDDGLIVYTQGRDSGSREEYYARPSDFLDGVPIVALVNSGSASAAEIVAGALQDRRRAVIAGNRTFGKGSVQTIVTLDDGSALKLTTSRYYTPSGHSIQARGITPDIELPPLRIEAADRSVSILEGNLREHLESDDRPVADPAAANPAESLAMEDFPLFQAINLLKGLALQRPGS